MPRTRWLVLTPIVLLLGGLAYYVSWPAPTGPCCGAGAAGQVERPPSNRTTLRIATFNIHGGKGRDDRRDLDRTAENLADLDFVALQEAVGPAPWESEGQVEQLARAAGMAWLFTPAERRWLSWKYGNGLLTALPLGSWRQIPLAGAHDGSFRNAVVIDVEFGGRTVHVLLTHLTQRDDRDRQSQLETVLAMFRDLPAPAVLLGDLNTMADDPQIEHLLATPDIVDPLRALGKDTPGRIDWIIVRGLRPVAAGTRDNGASDHPLLWAELELHE
jgi:endonuclease/exonuclease/phosphatase family metal-dependent hydrolase